LHMGSAYLYELVAVRLPPDILLCLNTGTNVSRRPVNRWLQKGVRGPVSRYPFCTGSAE
jgi:hypothetical protein